MRSHPQPTLLFAESGSNPRSRNHRKRVSIGSRADLYSEPDAFLPKVEVASSNLVSRSIPYSVGLFFVSFGSA